MGQAESGIHSLTLLERQILYTLAVFWPSFSLEDIVHLYYAVGKSYDCVNYLCSYAERNELSSLSNIPLPDIKDAVACTVPIVDIMKRRSELDNQVKVTQGDKETIIDNVISIEESFGDTIPMTDFCGGLSGVCPGCKQLKKERCGNIFITGRRRTGEQELRIETPETDYVFTGDDVEYEVLSAHIRE
jgi:hypothetical protein